MAVSQKCQYALRALFELARAPDRSPVKISDIATAQGIPSRFLEVILNELRQGGFVDSRRGKEGGYFLVREPSVLSVGEIIRFFEGPIRPAEPHDPAVRGGGAFNEVWDGAEKALAAVYDGATFAALIARDAEIRNGFTSDFTI